MKKLKHTLPALVAAAASFAILTAMAAVGGTFECSETARAKAPVRRARPARARTVKKAMGA